MKTRKFLAAWVLVGASLLLAACALASPQPTLDNTRWVLESLGGQPALANTRLTLNFENGRLGGSDGCNQYGTTYSASGGKLTVGREIMSTMMACAEPVMRQASAFTALLPQAAAYRRDGQQLTLLDAGGKTLAVFNAQGN